MCVRKKFAASDQIAFHAYQERFIECWGTNRTIGFPEQNWIALSIVMADWGQTGHAHVYFMRTTFLHRSTVGIDWAGDAGII